MYTFISILVILIVILIIYGFVNYNAIVTLSVNKDNAFADMEKIIDQMMELAKDMVNATGG